MKRTLIFGKIVLVALIAQQSFDARGMKDEQKQKQEEKKEWWEIYKPLEFNIEKKQQQF